MVFAFVINRPAVVGSAVDAPERGPHPKMTIVAEGGVAFVVPYAPTDTTLDGVAATFESVARAGNAPLLLRNGRPLAVVSFDLIIAYPDPQQSVERTLASLRALARSGARLVVNLDASTGEVRWRLTGFTQQTMMRAHGTNAVTRATVALTLTEASDPVVAVGPLTGGASGPPSAAAAGPVKLPTKHTFSNKDTLQSIAKQYYGDPKFASKIADANKLRRGDSVITGQKLTIPKK